MSDVKPRMWDSFPLRTCQSIHECKLCSERITLGQQYYDGGYGKRVHKSCVDALNFCAQSLEPKPPGKYDGTTMREVLEWCSDNVWSMMRPDSGTQGRWFVLMNDSSHHYSPTLYDALYAAWSSRNPTNQPKDK